jgi:hypothetical protein
MVAFHAKNCAPPFRPSSPAAHLSRLLSRLNVFVPHPLVRSICSRRAPHASSCSSVPSTQTSTRPSSFVTLMPRSCCLARLSFNSRLLANDRMSLALQMNFGGRYGVAKFKRLFFCCFSLLLPPWIFALKSVHRAQHGDFVLGPATQTNLRGWMLRYFEVQALDQRFPSRTCFRLLRIIRHW